MPKILIGVSSSFCANFLKGQVSFLVSKGFEVVIISGAGEEISILAKRENAKLHTVNFTRKISPFHDLRLLFQIINILKSEKPDIVNAGNPKSGFLIILACWFLGIRNRIFTLHGLYSDTKSGFTGWLVTRAETMTCNFAKQVIAVSESLRQHAIQRGILKAANSLIIEKGSCNGIDLDFYSRNQNNLLAASRLKEEIKLSGQEFLLGYVGRLSKDKGIEILFAAFNLLVKKIPNLRLIIAGPIEDADPFSRETMHQLYEDERIYYLGKMMDVAPVYCMIDILILPSFREGFPNVLLEAASMSVPVVSSRIPGSSDAMQAGFNGEFFSMGSSENLTDVLEKLIFNESERIRMGKNGRKFAEDNFSKERIWEGQLLIYNNMLNHSTL